MILDVNKPHGSNMTDTILTNGWRRLDNGFDVELLHGIPVRLSNNGLDIPVDDADLVDSVSQMTELKVTIVGWHQGETAGEQETRLFVDALQFEDVLHRLALFSAALFVDRYHTAIDTDSVDWDKAEYERDFNQAVEHCGLESSDMNKDDYYKVYTTFMHAESSRLIDSGIDPLIEPE